MPDGTTTTRLAQATYREGLEEGAMLAQQAIIRELQAMRASRMTTYNDNWQTNIEIATANLSAATNLDHYIFCVLQLETEELLRAPEPEPEYCCRAARNGVSCGREECR
jgi:hypothetical protein